MDYLFNQFDDETVLEVWHGKKKMTFYWDADGLEILFAGADSISYKFNHDGELIDDCGNTARARG